MTYAMTYMYTFFYGLAIIYVCMYDMGEVVCHTM